MTAVTPKRNHPWRRPFSPAQEAIWAARRTWVPCLNCGRIFRPLAGAPNALLCTRRECSA